MITKDKFYGGSVEVNMTTSLYRLVKGDKRLILASITGASTAPRLPDARTLENGGVHFYIFNMDAVKVLTISDYNGNALATVNGEECGIVTLVDNTTQNGTWVIKVMTIA